MSGRQPTSPAYDPELEEIIRDLEGAPEIFVDPSLPVRLPTPVFHASAPAPAPTPQEEECPICCETTTADRVSCCNQVICFQCWRRTDNCPFCRAVDPIHTRIAAPAPAPVLRIWTITEQRMNDENERLQAENTRLQRFLAQIGRRNITLQAENERLQAENRSLQAENGYLFSERRRLQDQLSNTQRFLANARTRAREAEQDLDTMLRGGVVQKNKRQRRDQNDQ